MQETTTLLSIIQERGARGLPLQHVYRMLYNRNLSLTAYGGSVANFAQEVMKGRWPLSVWRLSGEGVELFGRSTALCSLLDSQLPLLDQVHELHTDPRSLGCRT